MKPPASLSLLRWSSLALRSRGILLGALSSLWVAGAARADDALSDALQGAVSRAPSLNARARPLLESALHEAALPLPALTGESTLRLRNDLEAVISARYWPFTPGRDETLEGAAFIADCLRFEISQLDLSRLPDADAVVRLRAFTDVAATAVTTAVARSYAAETQETRQRIISQARSILRSRAALMGNVFVPLYRRPCEHGAERDAEPALTPADRILKRLLEDDFLAMRRSMPQTLLAEDPVVRATAEAQVLADVAMDEIGLILAPCQSTEGSAPELPAELRTRDALLRAGDEERQRRDGLKNWTHALVDPRTHEVTRVLKSGHDPVPETPANRVPTLEAALAQAFDRSGVIFVHDTVLLPRSWELDRAPLWPGGPTPKPAASNE